jgi:hypothetical protein
VAVTAPPVVRAAEAGRRFALRDHPAAGHRPHRLHGPDRDWTEVNCYVDRWVELLAWLGLDPVPALVCALSADVDDDQWRFLKPEPEDLRLLYGIEVRELNLWRPVLDHVARQLAVGRLVTVEVDSWFLPDTRGRAYRLAHEKTTIVPQDLDLAQRTLGYFHGPSYFELGGEDFDGLFAPALLPPYVETIALDRLRRSSPRELAPLVVERAAAHLRRAPDTNPIGRLAEALDGRLDWLAQQDAAVFHAFAFGTARQCGGTAELAADLAAWLAEHAGLATSSAVEDYRTVSEAAKALQFTLARVARGRRGDVATPLGRMAEAWERGQTVLRGALL